MVQICGAPPPPPGGGNRHSVTPPPGGEPAQQKGGDFKGGGGYVDLTLQSYAVHTGRGGPPSSPLKLVSQIAIGALLRLHETPPSLQCTQGISVPIGVRARKPCQGDGGSATTEAPEQGTHTSASSHDVCIGMAGDFLDNQIRTGNDHFLTVRLRTLPPLEPPPPVGRWEGTVTWPKRPGAFGRREIWYSEMWHTKLYHILPWYLRTEVRGCRVQNH